MKQQFVWYDEVVRWPDPGLDAMFDRIWSEYLDRLEPPTVPVPESFVSPSLVETLPQDVASPWSDLVALERELLQSPRFPRFYLNEVGR